MPEQGTTGPAVAERGRCDVYLPVDPFTSNRYHFGMLLGVADLEAEQAYHRGKAWLHAAWLHGMGTVWGLDVVVRAERNELVVSPGLAVDAHGRELRVTDDLCVDLGRWYAERRPDDLEVDEREDGGLTFTAHVVLCHDPCLDRPVPSISEPCEDATFDTAYSRAVERGVPRIVAGPPPDEPPTSPRLRQLFGQAAAGDPLVVDALAAIDAASEADRPAVCVAWLRRLAAADSIDLAPEDGALAWSPVAGDGCVPLATIEVHLRSTGDRFVVVDDGDDPTTVDPLIRLSHVRTRTLQELLCCCAGGGDAAGPGEGPGDDTDDDTDDDPGDGPDDDRPAPPAAATGPQVSPDATVEGTRITLTLTDPVDPRTVAIGAFAVAALRNDGWNEVGLRSATLDDGGTTVRLTLAGASRARPLRVVARGAGPTPILGTDGRPLDGVAGTGPSDPTGRDAALLLTEGEDPR